MQPQKELLWSNGPSSYIGLAWVGSGGKITKVLATDFPCGAETMLTEDNGLTRERS